MIYIFPSEISEILRNFAYGDYWKVFRINLQRQRYFIDIYDFCLIPLFFYFIKINNRFVLKVIPSVLIFSLTIFAFVSNFRSHILMLFASIFGLIFFGMQNRIKNLLLVLIFIFLITNLIPNQPGRKSTLDRILYPEEEEYKTLETRYYLWDKSMELGLNYPINGIGLGNFYEYLPTSKKLISTFEFYKNLIEITYIHPHNIFFETIAETGFLGLVSVIMLISHFAIKDLTKLKYSERFNTYAVISFWSLLSFSLFNPVNSLIYQNLLWTLRAIIERTHNEKFE